MNSLVRKMAILTIIAQYRCQLLFIGKIELLGPAQILK
jgi:hypothetical protein